MESIKHSNLDPTEFFNSVIDAKREKKEDTTYLKRVINLKDNNAQKLEDYSNSFSNNSIESLSPMNINSQRKDDLLSLYIYGAKPFRDLIQNLNEQNGGHEIARCPHCGVNTPSTLDHFLPKTVLPEFAIHPLNLIPCCPNCNGHKSEAWHRNGERACFNVYLDKEPDEQFLFCDVVMINNIPSGRYRIDGSLVKDKDLYALIKRTFSILHLIELYNKASDKILDNLKKQIRHQSRNWKQSQDELLDYLLECYRDEPYNDRENIYCIALLNNEYSRNFFKELITSKRI